MTTIPEAIRNSLIVILQALYGFVGALFAYDPNAGTYNLPGVVAQLMSNPCNVRQGLLGLLFSTPGLISIVGLVVVVVGGIACALHLLGWFANIISGVVEQGRLAVSGLMWRFSQGIGKLTGRQVAGGMRGMGADYGYGEDAYGASGTFGSLSKAFRSLAIMLVGLLMVASANQIQGVISTLGSIISGLIMLPTAIGLQLVANLISVSTGSSTQPLCATSPSGLTPVWEIVRDIVLMPLL